MSKFKKPLPNNITESNGLKYSYTVFVTLISVEKL